MDMNNSTVVSYERQLRLLPPEKMIGKHVTLIGAGGVGSPVAMTLMKMGIPWLTVWDDDKVEAHNLPNQMYRASDLGRFKAEALRILSEEYGGATRVEAILDKYRASSPPLTGIVVSAVDSMDARTQIWNKIKGNPEVSFYIEARMGAEVLRVYSLNPNDQTLTSWYETMLYPDEAALDDPCTERAIMYTVMFSAGMIASHVKKHIVGEPISKEVIFDLKTPMLVVN